MHRSDRDLMVAFQQGDTEAFAALYRRYRVPLVNFFYKMCYDRALAMDLVQETFLRLMRAKARYRPQASFRSYLYAVARNLFIDRYRHRRAAPGRVSAELRNDEDGEKLADRLPAAGKGPVEALAEREAAARVRAALRELPLAQREVFLLAVTEGLKYREIAEVLGVPVGTVKSRMHAAVARLRGLLGRELG